VNRQRFVSYLRQRDWPGMFFELLVVALGVLLGIQASNWNDAVAERRRTALIIEALRKDLRDDIFVEREAAAQVDAGLAAFDAARIRGERPLPYFFRIPGSDTPPNTIWNATLQSGLANLVNPDLLFDLGFYYSEREGIGLRYVRYATFVENEILPRVKEGPSAFYDGNGDLKPEFAANMDRLREWRSFLAVSMKSSECLEARFARPTEPGRSCRADYGPEFTPEPD
jgi:hypothetical protein